MQFSANQEANLKGWMINWLDNLNDVVDSEVLSDFVLVLLKGDGTTKALRDEMRNYLHDILEDETEQFIHDLFQQTSQLTAVATPRSLMIAAKSISEPSQSSSRKRQHSRSPAENTTIYTRSLRASPFEATNARLQTNGGGEHCDMGRPLHPADEVLQTASSTSPVQQLFTPGQPQNTMCPQSGELGSITFPTQQAFLMSMQQAFPFLTQMWMNSACMQGQTMQEGSYSLQNQSITLAEQSAKANSPAAKDVKCYDYDLTGLCIRGDSCPYKHERSRSSAREPINNHQDDVFSSSAGVLARSNETLFMQKIHHRQAQYQADHNARKQKEQDMKCKRAELASKSRELSLKLEAEKAALAAKIIEKEGRTSAKKDGTDCGAAWPANQQI